jgi:predicted nucleotidyltransferase
MESLTRDRTRARLRSARACVAGILSDASDRGVVITVVGSLAREDFRLHSDIDLLVQGETTPSRRAMVERMVASRMRGTGISYDLVFASDLSETDVKRLLDGDV